jgi:hypothetical protein
MIEVGKTYKFVTTDSFYTGTVLKYDKPLIKIRDKYQKEIILNENDINKIY